MTTYQTNAAATTTTYKEPSSNRGGIKFDNTAPGSLARRNQNTGGSSSNRSGSYGNGSNFRPPQNATQARRMDGSGNYGNPMRNHVDVSASEVPGSKRQTLGNRARVASENARQNLGRAARTASSVAGAVGRRVAPVVGVNAKGEIDFGLRAGGFGVSASVTGRVSVSALSNTVTWKPGDKDDWSVESGFGLWSQDSTRNGCSVVITTRFNGKIISQQVREADDCREPEPTPEPTPSPTPNPKPGNELKPKVDESYKNQTLPPIPPCYTGWVVPVFYFESTTVFFSFNFNRMYLAAAHSNEVKLYGFVPYPAWDPPEEIENGGWRDGKITYKKGMEYFTEDNPEIRIRESDVSNTDFGGNNRYFSGSSQSYQKAGYTHELSYYREAPPNCVPYRRRVPMKPEECDCELLGKIYDMLGGDQFYEKGLTVPVELFTPGGSGGFKMRSYNEIMNIIFRTFSHRTPGEIEFTITDTNKGKEGNQSVQIKTLNAQGYYTMLLKSISNLGYENTDQMNLLVRLGVVTTQLMKLAVLVNQNLKNVLGFFDIPTKDVLEKVDVPFDLSLKGSLGKGFGSREELQKELLKIVDKDTEDAIEGILDRFLNEWQMPVTTQRLRSTKEGGNFWYFLKQLRG